MGPKKKKKKKPVASGNAPLYHLIWNTDGNPTQSDMEKRINSETVASLRGLPASYRNNSEAVTDSSLDLTTEMIKRVV